MSVYSIKDLENLSGVKAHTIRIWEQRYNLLTPNRTQTNIRTYGDKELRKLLNITTLISGGLKISAIAKLNDDEVNERISELLDNDSNTDVQTLAIINKLIEAGLSYNEALFEKVFASSLLRFDLKGTYTNVIYPMLMKVGLMWSSDDLNPAQEHFISNLIRQKILAATDALPPVDSGKQTWLLFLPNDEDHEIGLLLSAYLIKQAGYKVVYLGQRVPYENLQAVISDIAPDYLLYFHVLRRPIAEAQTLINQLSTNYPTLQVYLSSPIDVEQQLELPVNFQAINSVEHFLEKIQQN